MVDLHVSFGPCDPLNVELGYQIRVERRGELVLFTSRHPVTGKDLDFAGCVEVAAMYSPKAVAQ